MILPYAVAALLWIAIIIYASLEGADFGGGLWDFLAFGPQKGEMRKLIKDAIAPVWEANNVWLTYLIVGLMTAFPIVAQLLTTALFIPLVLILIGIVLRGATFIFRSFSSSGLKNSGDPYLAFPVSLRLLSLARWQRQWQVERYGLSTGRCLSDSSARGSLLLQSLLV